MDIVMFGEPVTKVFQAQALASKADLMIVIGCSLTVSFAEMFLLSLNNPLDLIVHFRLLLQTNW